MVIEVNPNGYDFSLEKAEVGDKLMVHYPSLGTPDLRPVTVIKVTQHRISTSDGNQWMIRSHSRFGSSQWDGYSLCPYDEATINEAESERRRLNIIHRLRDVNFKMLPLHVLEQIDAVVKENEKEAAEGLTGLLNSRNAYPWILLDRFRGKPNSSPLAWWWNEADRTASPELDEILLGENGQVCGKGGCGADYYTHVMLAGFERPLSPSALTPATEQEQPSKG